MKRWIVLVLASLIALCLHRTAPDREARCGYPIRFRGRRTPFPFDPDPDSGISHRRACPEQKQCRPATFPETERIFSAGTSG